MNGYTTTVTITDADGRVIREYDSVACPTSTYAVRFDKGEREITASAPGYPQGSRRTTRVTGTY